MIVYSDSILPYPAAVNLDGSEGCFVTLTEAGAVTPAAADTAPDEVHGILHSTTDEVGAKVAVILPCWNGICGASVAAGSDPVKPGDRLVLAAGGQVTTGATGTVVAVAVKPAAAGERVPVRLVDPYAIEAE